MAVQHIAASGALLKALRGRPGAEATSRAERLRLEGVLSATAVGSPSTAEWADIATAVIEAGFSEVDEAALLDVIAAKATTRATASPTQSACGRAALQEFESLHRFFPASVWESMRSGGVEGMVNFLIALGLRHPTEGTSRAAACTFLAGSEGFEKAASMDATARMTTAGVIKKMLRDAGKVAPKPTVFLAKLPATPAELEVAHRAVYEAVYSENGPADPPFSEVQLQTLKCGTRCRGLKRGSSGSLVNSGGPSTPGDAGVGHMWAFGQAMLQQMVHMQSAIAGLQTARGIVPATPVGPMLLSPPPRPQAQVAQPSLESVAQQLMLPVSEAAPAGTVDAAAGAVKKPKTVGEATAEILAALDSKARLRYRQKATNIRPKNNKKPDPTKTILQRIRQNTHLSDKKSIRPKNPKGNQSDKTVKLARNTRVHILSLKQE